MTEPRIKTKMIYKSTLNRSALIEEFEKLFGPVDSKLKDELTTIVNKLDAAILAWAELEESERPDDDYCADVIYIKGNFYANFTVRGLKAIINAPDVDDAANVLGISEQDYTIDDILMEADWYYTWSVELTD